MAELYIYDFFIFRDKKELSKREEGHFTLALSETFTMRKITTTTSRNVISTPKNWPTRNGPNVMSCQTTPGGVAYCIIGMRRSVTSA